MRFTKRKWKRWRQLLKQKVPRERSVCKQPMQAEASAAKAVEVMEGCVQQLAHESGVHMLRVIEEVTQRLETEINAAATSTAAIAQTQTRDAVEGIRRDLEAQMEQNLAESRRREQEHKNL